MFEAWGKWAIGRRGEPWSATARAWFEPLVAALERIGHHGRMRERTNSELAALADAALSALRARAEEASK